MKSMHAVILWVIALLKEKAHQWTRGCTLKAGRRDVLGSNPIAPDFKIFNSFEALFRLCIFLYGPDALMTMNGNIEIAKRMI